MVGSTMRGAISGGGFVTPMEWFIEGLRPPADDESPAAGVSLPAFLIQPPPHSPGGGGGLGPATIVSPFGVFYSPPNLETSFSLRSPWPDGFSGGMLAREEGSSTEEGRRG